VFCEDLPGHELLMLEDRFPGYVFIRGLDFIGNGDMMQKIPLRLRYWLKGSELYPDETLCFLDCDTALRAGISSFIDDTFDVLYTWKDESVRLNGGVIIVNNNAAARAFMRKWLELTEETVNDQDKLRIAIRMNGGGSQHALATLIDTRDYGPCVEREIDGEKIRFKGVHCRYLNETRSCPITRDTRIIHYKAGWHPILIKGASFTEYRPEEACREMLDYWDNLYRDSIGNSVKCFAVKSFARHEGAAGRDNWTAETAGLYSIITDFSVDTLIVIGKEKAGMEVFPEGAFRKGSRSILRFDRFSSRIRRILAARGGKNTAVIFVSGEGGGAEKISRKLFRDFPQVVLGCLWHPAYNKIPMKPFDRVLLIGSVVPGAGGVKVIIPVPKEKIREKRKSLITRCADKIRKRVSGA